MINTLTSFIYSNLMWFWLAVMIICLVIEALTVQMTTVWAAISAFVLIFLSKTEMAFKWQLIVFLVLTIVLIVFTRPFVMKKLKLGKNVTNVNSMAGQEVLVTQEVTQFQKGLAKAKNGVIWTVTSADGSDIPVNSVCVITQVNGNTLVIQKK